MEKEKNILEMVIFEGEYLNGMRKGKVEGQTSIKIQNKFS